MWSRSELKERAKKALSVNYWRMVLASLILMIITGSMGTVTYKISNKDVNYRDLFSSQKSGVEKFKDFNPVEDAINDAKFGQLVDQIRVELPGGAIVAIVALSLVLVLIIVVIGCSISIFVKNPLCVGGAGFFVSNGDGMGELSEFVAPFKRNYLQVVLGMVLRQLYVFLWSILFVIPGIIKGYEYRMVPYLLADMPDIKQRDAFDLSKQMMKGNKWHAFVLDLSFIGWGILNIATVGLLGVFFVGPYKNQTDANLYLKLKQECGLVSENRAYENYVEVE